MASGIGLVVKIAADTKKAVGDIKDVNKALDGTGTSTGTASKMFDGLKSAALPVIGAVAVGVGAAAAAMVEFGKAAWEDHQEAQRLARVLETIPGITQDMVDANEAWITSTMFATHVMDTDLRDAVGKFTLQTKDLTTAQAYATAAANLATTTNTEYGTVVDAVEKALSGKTRALMAMAPWLDANKDGTLDAAEAASILTDKTLKGSAAAAAAEDPWTTITIIFDEIKEALGQWILPLFTRLGDWFKDPKNQQKIQDFITKLGDMSYQLGVKLLPYLEDFLDWVGSEEGQASMRNFADALRDMASGLMSIVDSLRTVKGWWDKLPQGLREFLMGKPLWTSDNAAGFVPRSAAPAASSWSAAPATRSSGNGGISINFYGGIHTDPEGTARAIQSSLTRSDWRNARPGRQLEPAW